MAITITHAKDHDVSSVTTYCSKDDILVRIPGLNIGTDLEPLANLGATTGRDALITRMLVPAKKKVDRIASQDFAYHEDVDIKLNGNGEDRLELAHFGFAPLLEVTSLVIDTTTMDADTFEWTTRGTIAYNGDTITETTGFKRRLTAGYFPQGEKNVVMNVSWGFLTIPEDVQYAAENFVVAELLYQLAAATANTADALAGGDVALEIGDLRVQPKTSFKYQSLATRLEDEAEKIIKATRPPIQVQLVNPEVALSVSRATWLRF